MDSKNSNNPDNTNNTNNTNEKEIKSSCINKIYCKSFRGVLRLAIIVS